MSLGRCVNLTLQIRQAIGGLVYPLLVASFLEDAVGLEFRDDAVQREYVQAERWKKCPLERVSYHMNWLQVVQVGVTWGIVLGLTFTAAVLIMGKMDVMMLLREYPPDIQAKAGPMPEASRRRAKQLQIPLVLVSDFVVACGLWQLRSSLGELRFAETFLASTVIFQVWNLMDLLWLDWFILMTLRPRFMILPGTEGLAGYRDYKFHGYKFARGIVLTTIMALIVTVIALAIEALI